MADYARPASGFRFRFDGIKTNSAPDAMPEFKYPYASNVRGYGDSSTQSRPQVVQSQSAPGGGNNGAVLSLEPTLGIYKIGTKLFYQGNQIDTGYASGLGASLCPFRPNASPNAYEYVFDQAKSSKVVVASGTPVVQKVGIAEPQSAPEACPDYFYNLHADAAAAVWTQAGTAGAPADITRSTEVLPAGTVTFTDPASNPTVIGGNTPASRVSLLVGTTQQYQVGQSVAVLATGFSGIIQDVIPGFSSTAIQVKGVKYLSGTSGKCSIALSVVPGSELLPDVTGGNTTTFLQTAQTILASFRRGALIQITGAVTEIVMILSATRGLDDSISLEVSTVNNQTTATALTLQPTIVLDSTPTGGGTTLVSSGISSAIAGAGTGTLTTATIPLLTGGLLFEGTDLLNHNSNSLLRQDDYFHFSVNVSDITQLSTTAPAIRIMFDVNNGAANFTDNYYYYDIQANDLTSAVASSQTQLGAASVSAQRQALRKGLDLASIGGIRSVAGSRPVGIDGGGDPAAVDFGSGGTQTSTGASQWTEVMFPIRALTRVGNDQTRTLFNFQSMRVQVVTTGAITLKLSSFWFGGGSTPDVGQVGAPLLYRVRPRSSVTGVKGNPSPATRYDVSPHRQQVVVTLPSAAYDSQIDTWDVFRFGGSITEWRYVGSAPSTSSTFADNIFDLVITDNELLSFDNLEPFPSIGPPISTSTAAITGTLMQATFPLAAQSPAGYGTLSQLGNLLPGNVVQAGSQFYTLQNRPTLVSTTATTQTYLFSFVENAGSQTNPSVVIQEPNLAAQPANRVFGPDAQGVFFSVLAGATNNNSVGLRAGLIQWTNPNDPDTAAASNTKDLCPPSEPLQNGVIVAGYPVVLSAKRAWSGIPQSDGSYAWREIPVSRGLAAEFGICTDGNLAYYVAPDGIRASQLGSSQSLTDADLYNLFPHEGIFPADYTYAGNTVFAPEYKFASNVRLACVNGFLYLDYLDANQNQRTLTCDLRKTAWCVDSYSAAVTIHAGTTNPGSNQKVPASATRNQQLYLGDSTGAIYNEQSSPVAGSGEIVSSIVITREEMVGDIRSNKLFGDAALDCLAAGSNMTVTPVFFGTVFGTSTTVTGGQSSRPSSPPTVNILGEQIKRSMGLSVSWTDQGTTSSLFMWQISYVTQPEDISNRITDWTDAGVSGNKFIQGFIITADTLNTGKTIAFRNGDTLALSETFTITMNGQQTQAFSFATPIAAHLIRLEPQDFNVWRLFGIEYVFQPMPESVLNWQCQATSFGNNGYSHVKEVLAAYSSTAPVTLTITCFDGNSPAVVTLPSTGGAYQKALFPLSPNKGLLYTFQATSTQPWQPYLRDWEIKVKEWGSSGPYQIYKNIGGVHGVSAAI